MYKMKEEMKVFRRTKGSKRWDYGNEQCYICLNFFFFNSGVREVAQLIKCLSHKHKDLSLDSQKPQKNDG